MFGDSPDHQRAGASIRFGKRRRRKRGPPEATPAPLRLMQNALHLGAQVGRLMRTSPTPRRRQGRAIARRPRSIICRRRSMLRSASITIRHLGARRGRLWWHPERSQTRGPTRRGGAAFAVRCRRLCGGWSHFLRLASAAVSCRSPSDNVNGRPPQVERSGYP